MRNYLNVIFSVSLRKFQSNNFIAMYSSIVSRLVKVLCVGDEKKASLKSTKRLIYQKEKKKLFFFNLSYTYVHTYL